MAYKKYIFSFCLSIFCMVKAQPTIYPAPAQTHTIALTHATIHTGNGDTLQNGMIVITNGKITDVKTTTDIAGATIIDCSGKQIYPALIDACTDLGLNEIAAVRSTLDENELGDLNPNVRALIAYNTDSRIINTVRSNGIFICQCGSRWRHHQRLFFCNAVGCMELGRCSVQSRRRYSFTHAFARTFL